MDRAVTDLDVDEPCSYDRLRCERVSLSSELEMMANVVPWEDCVLLGLPGEDRSVLRRIAFLPNPYGLHREGAREKPLPVDDTMDEKCAEDDGMQRAALGSPKKGATRYLI